jgi:FkbM family methyltransferase
VINALSLEAELDHLLDENIWSAEYREQTAFDRLTAPFGKSLVLFGAGNLGRQILAELRKRDIEPCAFADNNPVIWGRFVDGIEVLSPQDAAQRFCRQATFIVTIWNPGNHHQFRETKRQLHFLNCTNVISFLSVFWKYQERFLPNCFVDLPHKIIAEREETKKAFLLWEDEPSRVTYVSQLKWRMLENYDGLQGSCTDTQYFPEILKLRSDETFIDCGAYDGDTIKDFINKTNETFSTIHAFEPDPSNFNKLSGFVSSYSFKEKITLYQKAVGARFESLKFSTTGTASSNISSNGQVEVESVPLDSVLMRYHPTFVKMDIEGAEIDALMGAKKTIQKSIPLLAVCVYHRQNHLWTIPLLIKSFSKQYRFFLKAHREDGWDVVCYAIPANRLEV